MESACINQFGAASIITWLETQELPYAAARYRELKNTLEQWSKTGTSRIPDIALNSENFQEWIAAGMLGLSQACRVWFIPPVWREAELAQVGRIFTPDISIGNWCQQGETQNPKNEALQQGGLMIPTGGSSGKIKFALHSAETLSASVVGMSQFFMLRDMRAGDFIYRSNLPLYHVSGWMQLIRSFLSNSSWAMQNSAHAMNQLGNRWVSLVPTQLQRMLALGLENDLRAYDYILVGGGACDQTLLKRLVDRQIFVWTSYGLTETAGLIAAKQIRNLSDCGAPARALPHARFVTKEAETVREIGIQSKSMTLGIADESSFFEIGNQTYWTRDYGMVSDAGVSIHGRIDALINSGGEKINPLEVERAIKSDEDILDCLVVSESDEQWGQKVVCIFVLTPGSVFDRGAIETRLKQRLAPYKCPKKWIEVAQLPLDERGKKDHSLIARILALKCFNRRPYSV